MFEPLVWPREWRSSKFQTWKLNTSMSAVLSVGGTTTRCGRDRGHREVENNSTNLLEDALCQEIPKHSSDSLVEGYPSLNSCHWCTGSFLPGEGFSAVGVVPCCSLPFASHCHRTGFTECTIREVVATHLTTRPAMKVEIRARGTIRKGSGSDSKQVSDCHRPTRSRRMHWRNNLWNMQRSKQETAKGLSKYKIFSVG